MYRTKDDVLKALILEKTNPHSIRVQMSKYRLKKDLVSLLIFQSAVEEYNMFHKGEI